MINTKFLELPELASVHGADVDKLIVFVHALMAALFVGWSIYFFYSLWRFRAGKNPKADYKGVTSHSSSYVEGLVILAEAVLLLGFAIPLWAKAADKFPEEKDAVVMKVTGRQFNWIVRYAGPDGVFGKQDIKLVTGANPMGIIAKDPTRSTEDPAGADDIVLENSEAAAPIGKPVIAHITSLDVIHSFKVSALRVCQDAIPGLTIPVHFEATRTNNYMITCAQLCGQGHYSMKGVFKTMKQEDFDLWLATKVPTEPAEDVSYE